MHEGVCVQQMWNASSDGSGRHGQVSGFCGRAELLLKLPEVGAPQPMHFPACRMTKDENG